MRNFKVPRNEADIGSKYNKRYLRVLGNMTEEKRYKDINILNTKKFLTTKDI
jgi:hypothetical protein